MAKPVIPVHYAAEILGTKDLNSPLVKGLRHDLLYHSFKKLALEHMRSATVVFEPNDSLDPLSLGRAYEDSYTSFRRNDFPYKAVPLPFPCTLFLANFGVPLTEEEKNQGLLVFDCMATLLFKTPQGVSIASFVKLKDSVEFNTSVGWHMVPNRMDLRVETGGSIGITCRQFGKQAGAKLKTNLASKHFNAVELRVFSKLLTGENLTVALPGKPILTDGKVTYPIDGPTYDYRVCYLEHGKVTFKKPHQGGTHAPPKQHMRRGHWRTSKNGVRSWVGPMLVGDPARGFVEKEYMYA